MRRRDGSWLLPPLLLLLAACAAEPAPPAPPPPVEAAPPESGRPCFPGAQGWGTRTPGGRGGAVLLVTHLRDGGPGSLRAAVEAELPRVVVFRVAGTVTLEKKLEITAPFLTVAGETAPGGGICLRGAPVLVRTHDVVLRHLRVRLGPGSQGDALRIGPAAERVVVDHCSLSWGVDETVSVTGANDVTLSWCLIAEGLREAGHEKGQHSMGLLMRQSRRVAIHHCLFARSRDRNPQLEEGSAALVLGNVVSHWKNATRLNDMDDPWPGLADVVDNLYLNPRRPRGEVVLSSSVTHARVFLRGNRGPRRASDPQDEWALVTDESPGGRFALDARGPTLPPCGVESPGPGRAWEAIRACVGALPRDACDARIVRDVEEGSGPDAIDDPAEVGGWPALDPGSPPPDRDGDGLPDAWEREHGLDPADPRDVWSDPDGDGTGPLEAWLIERAAALAHDAAAGAAGGAGGG